MESHWKNQKNNKVNRYNRNPEMLSIYLPLAKAYAANPEEYVKEHIMILHGRRRRIVTYRTSENGAQLRLFHQRVAAVIQHHYQSSDNSYAYKKKRGILDFLHRHIDSACFLKTDIHAYFDSLRFEDLLAAAFRSSVLRRNGNTMRTLLSACFFNDRLPIGFVSSPVLSDLYLVKLDRKLSAINGMVYTRYADDFLLSVHEISQKSLLEEAYSKLAGALSELGLELNNRKTYYRNLASSGDAIHVLGLNLVRQDEKSNRITVSDGYLRQVSMLAGELKEKRMVLNEEDSAEIFTRLAGQISFIKHASSASEAKLARMLEIKLGYREGLDSKSLRKYFKVPISTTCKDIKSAVEDSD